MHLILFVLSAKTLQWSYVVCPLHSLYDRCAQLVLDFYTSPTLAGVMLNFWVGRTLISANSCIFKELCSGTLTDSGALMKTLDFPSWYWSGSMLTDWSRWRTPCFSSPFHEGQVALVRMAYLNHQGEEVKTWGQTAAAEHHWLLASITLAEVGNGSRTQSLVCVKMHSIRMFPV